MAQITQQPRVANANNRQKPTDKSKVAPATLQVVTAPAAAPEAPKATSPAPGAEAKVSRSPVSIIQGALKNAARMVAKTQLRTVKWASAEASGGPEITSMKAELFIAFAAISAASTALGNASAAGFAPTKMSSTQGKGKKASMAMGDSVKLSAKFEPSFKEILTGEELNSLVVGSITSTGKVVVVVAGTQRMIGVFHAKALIRL